MQGDKAKYARHDLQQKIKVVKEQVALNVQMRYALEETLKERPTCLSSLDKFKGISLPGGRNERIMNYVYHEYGQNTYRKKSGNYKVAEEILKELQEQTTYGTFDSIT